MCLCNGFTYYWLKIAHVCQDFEFIITYNCIGTGASWTTGAITQNKKSILRQI